MSRESHKTWRHDIRSSLNGVICMGSILEETNLDKEQLDILEYMISSANKAIELLEDKYNSVYEEGYSADHHSSCPSGIVEETLRVLVAEDDEINRLYLTTILKRQNWEIDEAADGFQAIELCRRNTYNMILMDVSMPELDGFQAARQIRERGVMTPIIAITAHSLLDIKDNLVEAGVNEVLRKPFNEDDLLNIIRKMTTSPE